MALGLASLNIRQGHPDFLDLPWHLPLGGWPGKSERVVEVERGLCYQSLKGGKGPAPEDWEGPVI